MRIAAAAVLSIGLAVLPGTAPAVDPFPRAERKLAPDPTIFRNGFEIEALLFVPDAGIRIDNASNAKAGVDGGVVYLYYEDRIANGMRVATSVDGLAFGAGVVPTNWTAHPSRVQLPGGGWRRYQLSPQYQLSSQFSNDGINFTPEVGTRYSPAPADNGTMGVYDIFASGNQVVMLYLGDLFGANNARRAVSSDNGVTFTYDRADILGDGNAGGGANSYVDIESRPLPSGGRRLYAMRGGIGVYSFLLDATGTTAVQEPGARVLRTDWTEFTVSGVFDPTVVRLNDGRYRIFVTGQIGNRQAIISATSVE